MSLSRKFVLIGLLVILMTVPVVSVTQAQVATPILLVNTSFLNVRTGPGPEYGVLVVVAGGTELPVLGVATDGAWYMVSTPVGNGWVDVDYTLPRGDFRLVPQLDTTFVVAPLVVPVTPITIGLTGAGQGGGAPGGTVERFRALINVEAVNLHVEPSLTSGVLTVLLKDDTKDYAIVGRSSRDSRGIEWYAIHVPGVGSGWVEAPKIFLRLSARYRDVLTVVGTGVQVYRQPGFDSTGLPVLENGDEVFLLNITRDGLWVQIETGTGVVGWIPFHSVVTRTGTTTDDLNPFEPDDVNQGGFVTVQGVVIPGSKPALAAPIAVVNTGNLNVRSGPGGHFADVGTLPGGSQVAVIGLTPDAEWYLVIGSFGQGWIDSEFVLVRGNLTNVPVIAY